MNTFVEIVYARDEKIIYPGVYRVVLNSNAFLKYHWHCCSVE